MVYNSKLKAADTFTRLYTAMGPQETHDFLLNKLIGILHLLEVALALDVEYR